MRTRTPAFVVALAMIVVGCATSGPKNGAGSVPTLSSEKAAAAGLSMQEVDDGTKLYALKCARCHKFYDPAQYPQPEWDTWMRKMSRKARLKPDQAQLLSRYLDAFRK